jgi:hypothetical protein
LKKRMMKALALMLMGMLWTGIAAAQSDAAESDQRSDVYEQALTLYHQGLYDDAIKQLQGPSATDPYDEKINGLLARAYLDKCEMLKKIGDKNYRYYIKSPYVIGIRLLKAKPTQPEPYYLVAKSLLLNNRPLKASRSIEKAIYYAGPQHKNYCLYWETKGDCWTDMMVKRKDMRGHGYAKKSYQTALSAAKDDAEAVARIRAKIVSLDKKYKRS